MSYASLLVYVDCRSIHVSGNGTGHGMVKNQGGLTSVYKTEIVQNLVHHEPQCLYTYVSAGGIMKITFFNFHDNFQCLIIFFWKMDMNSIQNSKCKYERIV